MLGAPVLSVHGYTLLGAHKCIFTYHALTPETGRGRHTTVGRTPLEQGSARRRDLYLTTHSTHNRYLCPRRDSNPNLSKRAAADPRRTRRGNRDQGHSSSEMKQNLSRQEKNWSFFSDYGSSLLVTANTFPAKYISISVRV